VSDAEFNLPLENVLYTNEMGTWNETIVNDQFFYGNQDVMNVVTKTYDELDYFFKNGFARNAPEYIFYHSLKKNNILISKKPINYYLLKRAKGEEYH
jgi:hypothetical protein